MMARIIAVCRSKKKGVRKEVTARGTLRKDYGLVGDAHAECSIRRQVSLLAIESIDKMRKLGFNIEPGKTRTICEIYYLKSVQFFSHMKKLELIHSRLICCNFDNSFIFFH